MTSKNEVKLAYWLAAVFLVVGVLSYTAFSAKPPEEPVRMVLTASTGKVVFDHSNHTYGYGLDCSTCHHHVPEAEKMRACGDCHNLPEDGSAPQKCIDCHSDPERSVTPEDFDMELVPNRADSFHLQCAGCHEQNGAGPVANDCSLCHIN